ncbi:MAG: ATP-dependent DNA helicase RecG [Gammaproteobacteria bacterium RIFCSPHIGHO2_12_FULL_38_11]|nr:MAG: ATP-dependent DNA helicase RecG [Gammaproteobacteria bacterium RIFCSPHIGHO2_12_FULL_38_11]
MTPISITILKGVGPKCAELLAHLNILTVQDLLLHLPLRYEDRSRVYSISEIKSGDRILIEGTIESVQIVGARRYLKCVLRDGARSIDLVFYYFAPSHYKRLLNMRGRVRCFGEVRFGFSGHLEMTHPEYASVNQIIADSVLSLSPCLLPVYPATKGLQQNTLRKLMRQALSLLLKENILPELLPDAILKQFNFFILNDALSFIHFPPMDINPDALLQGKHPALVRLIVEELIAHQLSLQQLRRTAQLNVSVALAHAHDYEEKLLAQLPFQLTNAQSRVLTEIQTDLMRTTPMLRLLQGDVGSGKTIVACFAALNAIAQGHQVALMAPTEILSEQHFQSFLKWLSPLNIKVDLLLGRQSELAQKSVKAKLLSGEIDLIIGTHALFQSDVAFKNLSLLIIDEQHRFGVHQRLALMKKGLKTGVFPHQLIMTATPIPRTLAMTAYADLDFSVIDELPPGRKPISTVLIASSKRDDIIARVKKHCQTSQAYWICTLIDESELLQCQAAETTFNYLKEELRELRIALIHGRLKSDEKNAIMTAFQLGEIDLLVATTVVEVGVDVPNACLMIIENPERLGLSQLHQLRGRVGRGSQASFCVLLYQPPLSDIAKKRLSLMRETQDGFVIAEQDLKMRGPGDVLGARQSGLMQLRIADLMRDQHLLSIVQTVSQQLISDHPAVVPLLMQRWIAAEIKYLHA